MVAGVIGLVNVRFLPDSARVPLRGSQPMVGYRQQRRELITTSMNLYSFSKKRPETR
ncbi:hypothetical protein GCM10010279_26740 [Streptomyces mutabilis]|nr:hypothetical protein GCM10010279_26740 [Streptomyces mutabilis]